MYFPNNIYYNKPRKQYVPREKGIPDTPLFHCHTPTPEDIPPDSPFVCVGCDTGISNVAFSYVELINDKETKAVVDFKYKDSYYFEKELSRISGKIEKQLYIMNQYQELFSHKFVTALVYEVLPLNQIKDEKVLSGVIDAQTTTDLLNATAYMLNHPYCPTPITTIKHCLTGNGKASKQEMKVAAYNLTGDERFLENDHMADAFADAFYGFIKLMKEDCVYYNVPIPDKFKHMTWNFKKMPLAPWEKGNKN